MSKRAVIIGAGPAGLTAALELLQHTDIKPVIYEMSGDIGGISKTVSYKGNRIDAGGHRFFSRSSRIVQWWKTVYGMRSGKSFLTRQRISRIFHLRKFFDYPVSLSIGTIRNLGGARLLRIIISYFWARMFPINEERSLEDFFVNRFGRELYLTFFKDYTEKVWGVPCNRIKPDWGAQRIKGLSTSKALLHAVKKVFSRERSSAQDDVETSLIDRFLYPQFGPGEFWQEVAEIIRERGGEIHLHHQVVGLGLEHGCVRNVKVRDEQSGGVNVVDADYVLSSMPVRDLVAGFGEGVPNDVRKVAEGLQYRDFLIVGVLVNKLKIKNDTRIRTRKDLIPDNWIYIQEPDVKLGRVQVFNNWSPGMVQDPNKVWLGLEYFCNEGDVLWSMSDENMRNLAQEELARIGFADPAEVLDSVVLRIPKAYPAYFGTYEHFDIIKNYTSRIANLFLIGRNGMHRYNNMDHSMMTAIVAVENIRGGEMAKDNIWAVNTERPYNEGGTRADRS